MNQNWRGVPKPPGVAELETDPRGYPILFTVQPDEGQELDFRVVNPRRRRRCAREGLCGVCGKKLGYWMVFIGGPRSAENRVFSDPPMHEECAKYALEVCPFLTMPTMQYKQRGYEDKSKYTCDPHAIAEKPGRMAVYVTRGFRVEAGRGRDWWIFRAKPAKRIEWRGADGRPLDEFSERAEPA